MLRDFRCSFLWFAAVAMTVSSFVVESTSAADFAPHATVLKDYQKVVSSADGKRSLYTIWVNKKTNQMYAELPSSYASQKYFIALTISSGDQLAGLQMGDRYVLLASIRSPAGSHRTKYRDAQYWRFGFASICEATLYRSRIARCPYCHYWTERRSCDRHGCTFGWPGIDPFRRSSSSIRAFPITFHN